VPASVGKHLLAQVNELNLLGNPELEGTPLYFISEAEKTVRAKERKEQDKILENDRKSGGYQQWEPPPQRDPEVEAPQTVHHPLCFQAGLQSIKLHTKPSK
jgi:hypothetical protein